MPLPVYEHPIWTEQDEHCLRPGGLSITKQALGLCHLPFGVRILDVGCGSGTTLRYINKQAERTGFGIDISANLLQKASKSDGNVHIAQSTAEHLPFGEHCLDVVISECVFSLVDAERSLDNFYRVLKPNGYLIMSDLYVRNDSRRDAINTILTESGIGSTLTQKEIVGKVEKAGFEISVFQDQSETMKQFSFCTLTTAAQVNSFDFFLAATKAKLGYYFLIARK